MVHLSNTLSNQWVLLSFKMVLRIKYKQKQMLLSCKGIGITLHELNNGETFDNKRSNIKFYAYAYLAGCVDL
jgi:hypothetical protein